MRVAVSKGQIVRVAIIIILTILALFANFYTIRIIERDGVELYFYEKMLVAYDIEGLDGIRTELTRTLSQDHLRREVPLAVKFRKDLDSIPDPYNFLTNVVAEKKRRMRLFENMRNAAIFLILAVLIIRVIMNSIDRARKDRDNA